MEFFKKSTHIDFMKMRPITGGVSLLLSLIAVFFLVTKGLNWGLDFTGGSQIEVVFPQAIEISSVRDNLQDAGFGEAVVQTYGSPRDVLISLGIHEEFNQEQLVERVIAAIPQIDEIRRVDFIGPQVGAELAQKGALAIVVALIGILLYVAFRFEYRLAISAVIALFHDPLLILGLFAFFQWEFDLTTLAAVLAVIGYSLNDTIVVFDRVRENFRRMRKGTVLEIVNTSINQTLSRTIITSLGTLFVLVALLVYGGEVIWGFAMTLTLGVIIGTYSSIFIAGGLAVYFGLSKQDLIQAPKEEVDDRP